jgi:hypothetical protein
LDATGIKTRPVDPALEPDNETKNERKASEWTCQVDMISLSLVMIDSEGFDSLTVGCLERGCDRGTKVELISSELARSSDGEARQGWWRTISLPRGVSMIEATISFYFGGVEVEED